MDWEFDGGDWNLAFKIKNNQLLLRPDEVRNLMEFLEEQLGIYDTRLKK